MVISEKNVRTQIVVCCMNSDVQNEYYLSTQVLMPIPTCEYLVCYVADELIKTFNVNLGEHLLYEFFKGNASSRQKVDNVS